MRRIEIFLPLYDNVGRRIPKRIFDQTAHELTEKFGGLTAYTRAPATGLWKKTNRHTARDDLVIYEVMCRTLNRTWWRRSRRQLERRFQQEKIVIRVQQVELL
jgi:hypothetical protein